MESVNPDHDQRAAGSPPRLADFLTHSRDALVRTWLNEVHKQEDASKLPEPALRDRVPELLDAVAERVAAADRRSHPSLADLPQLHAVERLDLGFDLRMVISEIAHLRRVILELWAKTDPPGGTELVQDIACLDGALDEVLASSVKAYADARERTLRALDRISNEPMGNDLGDFLHRLLGAILETSGAADTAKIFLVRGEDLVLGATAGIQAPDPDLRAMRIGEGFAGRIASEGRPRLLHSAWNDPTVRDPGIRSRGLRALYGVPLVHDDRVIGVAEMGSTTAFDFSRDEQQLFRAMVGKATAGIVHAAIEERERLAQQAAATALARLKTMVTGAPVGIAFLDPSLRYQLVSRWLGTVHGRSYEDDNGKTLREVLPSLADRLEPILHHVLEAREPAINVEVAFAAGEEMRTWLVSAYPVVTEQGELLGVGKVVTDITERKNAEELQRRTGEFRDLFLSIVAHDLRSPLAAIKLSSAAIARRRDVPESLRRIGSQIGAAAGRMQNMVADLMDFARGRLGGGIPVDRRPCDLADVVRGAVDEVRAAYPHATIELAWQGSFSGTWDADRLTQVFINLLLNAVHHGQGSPVRVTATGGAEEVEVEIHNGGPPIPPSLLPHIFDAFRGRDRLRSEGGLGLGLYIVDQIIRAHGGRIAVSSTSEAGTTFRVSLPRHAITSSSPTYESQKQQRP
jgi:PAS domain S-box-containing protein